MTAKAFLGQCQRPALEQRRAALAATRPIAETGLGHPIDGIAVRADDLEVGVHDGDSALWDGTGIGGHSLGGAGHSAGIAAAEPAAFAFTGIFR